MIPVACSFFQLEIQIDKLIKINISNVFIENIHGFNGNKIIIKNKLHIIVFYK